jgi:hypothetical protein
MSGVTVTVLGPLCGVTWQSWAIHENQVMRVRSEHRKAG